MILYEISCVNFLKDLFNSRIFKVQHCKLFLANEEMLLIKRLSKNIFKFEGLFPLLTLLFFKSNG